MPLRLLFVLHWRLVLPFASANLLRNTPSDINTKIATEFNVILSKFHITTRRFIVCMQFLYAY